MPPPKSKVGLERHNWIIDVASSSENDISLESALRSEIVESQKSQADFLKWKFIVVATVASAWLGFSTATPPAKEGTQWLLCLLPLICAYIDLISLHIMIRITTIGSYLKEVGNEYEQFIFEVRRPGGANPYIFEGVALHGSSLAIDLFLIGFGFLGLGLHWNSTILQVSYIALGFVGIVVTIAFLFWYVLRSKEVQNIAKRFQKESRAIRHS